MDCTLKNKNTFFEQTYGRRLGEWAGKEEREIIELIWETIYVGQLRLLYLRGFGGKMGVGVGGGGDLVGLCKGCLVITHHWHPCFFISGTVFYNSHNSLP